MKERIDIIVQESRLYDNEIKQRRLEKTYEKLPVDRIPVLGLTDSWTALNSRKVLYKHYQANAKENMKQQILNYKWCAENICDDAPLVTQELTVSPDFGSLRGTEFPMEIIWQDNQPPKTVHMLKEPNQIDNLIVFDPTDGLNARRVQWYREMTNQIDDFDVRLNGQNIRLNVTVFHPGGPIPAAYALAGENLLLWMCLDPDRVHKLMEIVTKSFLNCTVYFNELTGRKNNKTIWLGCDTGEMLSPAMFKEFVTPYYLKLWKTFNGGRAFHMCGKIDHLLKIIRYDMEITSLDGFGFSADIGRLKETLAGFSVMKGGPGPMMIYNGPEDEIINKCVEYIKTLGTKGGYILDAGGAIMAGTPHEHIQAMITASKQTGWPCE